MTKSGLVTLRLAPEHLKVARIVASRRGTSISGLVTHALMTVISEEIETAHRPKPQNPGGAAADPNSPPRAGLRVLRGGRA